MLEFLGIYLLIGAALKIKRFLIKSFHGTNI